MMVALGVREEMIDVRESFSQQISEYLRGFRNYNP